MSVYAGYIPIVQSRFMAEGYFSNAKMAQLMSSGLFDVATLESVISAGGDFANVPLKVQADDFSHVVLTTDDTQPNTTPTRITTSTSKYPVTWDASQKGLTEIDRIRTNDEWIAELSRSAGNKAAKRTIKQLDRVLKATLTAQATHIKDITAASTKTVNIGALQDCKTLLGDQSADLSIMLIHSKAVNNLYKELSGSASSGYAANAIVAGDMIRNGALNSILGVGTIIVSDDLTKEYGTGSSTGSDEYWTYLFRPGAVYHAYQEAPIFHEFVDSRVPSTLITLTWRMGYVIGPHGFNYGGAANPTDAVLGTSGNWSFVSEDHRNFGVVALVSQAT